MLMFSSGTTGLPKAVQLTHRNFIAEHTIVFEDYPRPFPSTRLLALPIFHVASTPSTIIGPFRDGVTTYIMRRFDLELFLNYIQEYQATELLVVPPMAIAIIMSPARNKYNLKSVKSAMCGAAPLDKGPQARLKALLADDAPFTQVWGMTETSCIASMFSPSEHDTTGSVGRMLNNLDVKLVADDGIDISAPGVRGELCIRGPTVTRGYFENEEANTRDFDSDSFFHTGDIAYMDGETELWYIVDRKKVSSPLPFQLHNVRATSPANTPHRSSSKSAASKSRPPSLKPPSSRTQTSSTPASSAFPPQPSPLPRATASCRARTSSFVPERS